MDCGYDVKSYYILVQGLLRYKYIFFIVIPLVFEDNSVTHNILGRIQCRKLRQ